jgi:hypothetical protein
MSITIALEPHKNPRIDSLTGTQRLRWVLEFIRQDLEALPSEVLEALGDDLRHATAPYWVEKKWNCTEMSAEEVRALQADIRAGVYALMGAALDIPEMSALYRGHPPAQGAWLLPEAPTYLLRVRMDRHGHRVRLVCMSPGTTDREAILTGVANLIGTYGDRLCTCPVCGTPFLRQYRQAYCTMRCSNKVRNRRRLDRKAHQKRAGQMATAGN